jgi:predicted kinase
MAERSGRRVVLVSGAPGAGKTTLAVPLAAELGFMLLRKDRIKETLHDGLTGDGLTGGDLSGDALGGGGLSSGGLGGGALARADHGGPAVDLAWSRRMGGAAMELLWALAADAPAVVLEANFRPYSAYERGRISALGGCVVEVNCVCPAEVAARRYAARAATTHPVHVLSSLSVQQLAEYDRPVGIGELITVDTTAPADVAEVAAAVRARLPAAGPARVTGSV